MAIRRRRSEIGKRGNVPLRRTLASYAGCVLCLFIGSVFADEEKNVWVSAALPALITVPTSKVIIEGQTRDAMLDTGATISTLDRSLESIATPLGKTLEIAMPDGVTRLQTLWQAPSFKLQSLEIITPTVIIGDLRTISRLTGRQIGLVVGVDQLRSGIISLNYDTNLFTISSGDGTLSDENSERVSLAYAEDLPVFFAEIEGNRLRMIVDSGSDSAIALPSSVFDSMVKSGLIDKGDVPVRGFSGSGVTASRRGWFTRGSLMGKNLAGIRVKEREGTRGYIGLEWLCAFNIEIDMNKRLLRYQLRKDAVSPASTQLMIGAILLYDRSGAVIERLRPGGGPLEDAGMETGDVIESIENLSGEMMNSVSVGEIVTAKAGQRIAIRVRKRDGSIVNAHVRLAGKISAWDYPGREYLKNK